MRTAEMVNRPGAGSQLMLRCKTTKLPPFVRTDGSGSIAAGTSA